MTVTNETLINNPVRDILDLTITGLDKLEAEADKFDTHVNDLWQGTDGLYTCLIEVLTFRLLCCGWDKDELKEMFCEVIDTDSDLFE